MASSTQHKASKEDKTKIDSFVGALKKKGITLVALDFDQTIIDIHSGGTWRESVDKLVPHVRPCFRDLMEASVKSDLYTAIVTYHRQDWLIKDLLHKIMPKKVAEKIYVQANTPAFMKVLHTKECPFNGKEAHIASIIQQIMKDHGKTVKDREVILLDDDMDNIRTAASSGQFAIQVQQNVDY